MRELLPRYIVSWRRPIQVHPHNASHTERREAATPCDLDSSQVMQCIHELLETRLEVLQKENVFDIAEVLRAGALEFPATRIDEVDIYEAFDFQPKGSQCETVHCV